MQESYRVQWLEQVDREMLNLTKRILNVKYGRYFNLFLKILENYLINIPKYLVFPVLLDVF